MKLGIGEKLIFILGIVFISACTNINDLGVNGDIVPRNLKKNTDDICIESFENFAYLPVNQFIDSNEKILPLPPWQNISIDLSNPVTEENYEYSSIEIIDANENIWIGVSSLVDGIFERDFLLFDTFEKQLLHSISGEIGETSVYVTNLFIVTGKIWGVNSFRSLKELPIKEIPIFSTYNEDIGRFEFVEDGISLFPFSNDSYSSIKGNPIVLLDSQNIFWVYLFGNGLFTFSPESREVTNHFTDPEYKFINGSISNDGKIYFNNPTPFSLEIQNNAIMMFDPTSNNFSPMPLPNNPWPNFPELYIDRDNNLWLGMVGYRDKDDVWHLLHKNTDEYFLNMKFGDYSWLPPRIILESSNGWLFSQKNIPGNRGTGWYDPTTKQGCWFTTGVGNLIEDQFGDFWMVVEDSLYWYDLKNN